MHGYPDRMGVLFYVFYYSDNTNYVKEVYMEDSNDSSRQMEIQSFTFSTSGYTYMTVHDQANNERILISSISLLSSTVSFTA